MHTHACKSVCALLFLTYCGWLGQIFKGMYGDIAVALKENFNFQNKVMMLWFD